MLLVQALTAGVLVATVAVLVTVLALLYTMPKPLQQDTCEKLCLPSIPFSQGSDLHCGCSSDRLHKYLDEAIIEKEENTLKDEDKKSTPGPSPQLMGLLKSLRWNIKPSARVTGKKQPPPRPYDGGMIPVREWHQKDDRAFLRYGMEYRHGRLVVPVKGLYHIHSFLDLYETSRNATSQAESTRRKRQTESYTEKAHQKERNLKMLISNPYKCSEGTQVVKPSVHLVGVTKSLQDMHEHHMLKWNQTGKLSNINGVVYEDGKLRVSSPGYYYIYSQITYQDHRDSFPYNDNDIVLHHSVHKEYNGGGDTTREKLLESSQSRCQIIGDKSNKTSYIGAVFYLKENDYIHVRVSHPPKLLPSEHSNYFGMYLT